MDPRVVVLRCSSASMLSTLTALRVCGSRSDRTSATRATSHCRMPPYGAGRPNGDAPAASQPR